MPHIRLDVDEPDANHNDNSTKEEEPREPATVARQNRTDKNNGIKKGGKGRFEKEQEEGHRVSKKRKRERPDTAAANDKPRQPQSTFPSLKEKAKKLIQTRKNLPIFSHADEIKRYMRDSDVMLLIGETGSGKSTQIPQFLIDEPWCRSKNVTIKSAAGKSNKDKNADGKNETKKGGTTTTTVGGCIAITQPRRVAAISLARRVAEEMGTPLGNSSPASKVGYLVRFDTSISPSTRIKFLTEGMLLQEMLNDPWLTKYSAVVVDEVHERGTNVDLVLGFLRNLVSGRKEGRGGLPLKVAVMSATVDMETLQGFFSEGLQQAQCGRGLTGETENVNVKEEKATTTDIKDAHTEITTCHVKGRQFPVQMIYSPTPVHDFVDAALNVIFRIHCGEPLPGDILVFLTGQETVEALEYLVNEYATGMDTTLPKIQVLPLFAALPQTAQQQVFIPAPPRTRKIILATNIAETSVTVPGVRYVVDCGKAKIKQFRSRLGLDSLLVKPISKSAAIQRKGRAGREAPGKCYRLYTEKDYLSLDDVNTPEILRCDLSQALLNMKARGVVDITGFPFLTPPPREALEKALLQLLNIEALDESGNISSIGQHIAKLPLTPTLGRVLLAAADNGSDCLAEVIDIISCLSVENIFLNTNSEEKKEEAEIARRDLYRREGDHLTMLATAQAYAAENTDRKAWAERHMVSHRAMQSVMVCRAKKKVTLTNLN